MIKIINKLKNALPEIKYILLLFLSTRLVLTVIGIFSRTLLERQYGKQYVWSKYLWLDIWGVWDTFWYLDIAEHGYSAVGRNLLSPNQANYAFFPFYPMLMRVIGKIIGDRYYIAGILISNLCLIIACLLIYKLVLLDFNKKTALNSVKYLFLFPTAFILSGVFTESVYLTLTILCFYLAKKRNWLFAGISGFFLSLTRNLGVLIIIPLLVEYLTEIDFKLKEIKINVIFLLLIPLGLFVYAAYNYYLTADFLAFTHVQSTWNRHLTNPLVVIFNGLRKGIFKANMRDLLEVSFTIISLAVLSLFYKKLDFSYLLFCLYSIIIPLFTGLASMPRFILPIFPLYILLAKLSKDRYLDQAITIFLGLLQGFLMVFWSCGFPLVV